MEAKCAPQISAFRVGNPSSSTNPPPRRRAAAFFPCEVFKYKARFSSAWLMNELHPRLGRLVFTDHGAVASRNSLSSLSVCLGGSSSLGNHATGLDTGNLGLVFRHPAHFETPRRSPSSAILVVVLNPHVLHLPSDICQLRKVEREYRSFSFWISH
jgi:hypothetical protein